MSPKIGMIPFNCTLIIVLSSQFRNIIVKKICGFGTLYKSAPYNQGFRVVMHFCTSTLCLKYTKEPPRP